MSVIFLDKKCFCGDIKYYLLFDLFSAFQSLRNLSSPHPILILQTFFSLDTKIIFLQSPGHTTITTRPVLQPNKLGLPNYFCSIIHQVWNDNWQNQSHTKLNIIKETVVPWSSSNRHSIKGEVSRITHLLLLSHNTLSPSCPCCEEET